MSLTVVKLQFVSVELKRSKHKLTFKQFVSNH